MSERSAQRSEPLSLDEVLTIWLPQRVDALLAMLSALELCEKLDGATAVHITVGDMLSMNQNLSTYVEPLLTVGYLHARALLEFMGLGAKNGKLVQLTNRKASDIAIEHYSMRGIGLPMVSLSDVYGAINMPRPVVEWSLVNIIETANKRIAHVTTGEVLRMAMYQQMRIGLESIPTLLHDHLYAKLELAEHQAKPKRGRHSCNSNG